MTTDTGPMTTGEQQLHEAEERARARFFTATAGAPPTDEQREQVAKLREQIVGLAVSIEAFVPGGRHKALALTALEDVQMRANRGLFAPEGNR